MRKWRPREVRSEHDLSRSFKKKKGGGKLKNMIGIACDVVCMCEREVFSSNWPEFAFKLTVDAMIKRAHM